MGKVKLYSFQFLYLDKWNGRGKFLCSVICIFYLLTYICSTYVIANAWFEYGILYCCEGVLKKGGNFM
jgi:hypothetical protein